MEGKGEGGQTRGRAGQERLGTSLRHVEDFSDFADAALSSKYGGQVVGGQKESMRSVV